MRSISSERSGIERLKADADGGDAADRRRERAHREGTRTPSASAATVTGVRARSGRDARSRTAPAVRARSRREPGFQLVQDDAGDGRQLEPARLAQGHPGELDQLGLRADHAADLPGDGVAVDREEAGVEALRPARGRDGAGDDLHRLRGPGSTPCSPKAAQGPAGTRLGRAVIRRAEEKPGLLEGLADGGERQRPAAGGRGPPGPGHQRLRAPGPRARRPRSPRGRRARCGRRETRTCRA